MSDQVQAAAAGSPQPGWYPDPSGGAGLRWWDGAQWTERTGVATATPEPGSLRSVYGPFIWLIALLPLLSGVATLLYRPGLPVGGGPASAIRLLGPGYLPLMSLGLLLYALTVVFAWLDHRGLRRAGLAQPFHWAFAFLGGLVYGIGRSVAVYRVARRGLAPIWVLIVVTLLNYLPIIWIAYAVANLVPSYPALVL